MNKSLIIMLFYALVIGFSTTISFSAYAQELSYDINAAASTYEGESILLNWSIGGATIDRFQTDQVSFTNSFLHTESIPYLPDSESENTYLITPNPFLSVIHVYNYNYDIKETNLHIYNLSGALVYHLNTHNMYESINLSFLSDGVYLVKLSNQQGTEMIKLIKN